VAKIYKLFSQTEEGPKTHTLDTASRVLPLIRRYTEETLELTEDIAAQMAYLSKNSARYKRAAAAYDKAVLQWVEKVHRLGAVAKGLWLVDFDTGSGYLCWAYPEERIEHFHDYEGGFKTRVKIETQDSRFSSPTGNGSEESSRSK